MIYLRKAKEEDLPIIRTIAEQTWPTAYDDIISQEQIAFMLEKMYNKGELLGQMLQGHHFIIASELEKEVGFAGFSVIDSDTHTFKLHKLYVLPKMHGKGVGKILMNEVVSQVKAQGGKFLQLNVNRANKAKDFYEKADFKIKETVDLDIGNGFYMNDYVMEKEL
ncbi:GNAT family N-acetyltransferase [Pedobacter xixiisoli]|uniref:Ribosomal protein S18 acetylase RimI n=1 Tax=Pedobacter xixiisoli TaxID=1476464 RepID=A0A286ACK3_9SPHI|nr:GNAT family N-acetyltransferase [Pedobacter xixiisoli]SOD19639.1 Ribosomal protein S18 acetylase RimI [Pedobacter xixiisoli]